MIDLDQLVREALARVNKHIDRIVKQNQREMKKQFEQKNSK